MEPSDRENLIDLLRRCRDFEEKALGWSTRSASASEVPADSPLPAESFGDFKILREIGRGGMGVVYLAEQLSLRRQVAIKMLPPGFAPSSEQRQRFLREAQAAARLRHPNIVPVFNCGEAGSVVYYSMLTGQSPREGSRS